MPFKSGGQRCMPFKSGGQCCLSNSPCFTAKQTYSRSLCLHHSYRARKHSFSHFANDAPLAVVSEMRTTPRQWWQRCDRLAPVRQQDQAFCWDLQLDCSSNGRVPVLAAVVLSIGAQKWAPAGLNMMKGKASCERVSTSAWRRGAPH